VATGGGAATGGGTATGFTVSGTVQGLQGTGLELTLNSTEHVTVAPTSTGPAAFAFTTRLAANTTYAVTVTHQPLTPSQTCALTTAGSGQITADVTNVVVTCNTDLFAIGGTLTGMTPGNTINLQVNGFPPQSVIGNGPFSLVHVQSGTAFTVTIATQPLGQTCTVSGGTGTVTTAPVTSVAVNCDPTKLTLGGSVNGLVGGMLVLTDSNAGTVTLTNNGTFSFPNPVADGTMYLVNVQQPTSPSQTCMVTNTVGAINPGSPTALNINCMLNSFSVGGLITGLPASGGASAGGAVGLTITYNPPGGAPPGSMTQTFSSSNTTGATSFTFPNIPSGSFWIVSVSTQPVNPSQTCTVTMNPNGTVGNMSTNNVVVACTTNSFAAGGSISGLAGGGLTLSLSVMSPTGPAPSPQPQTVGAPTTTFSFPNIPSGDGFMLSVSAQPTNPRQVCTVVSGTGVIGAMDFTGLSVQCMTVTWPISLTFVTLKASTPLLLTTKGMMDTAIATPAAPMAMFTLRANDNSPYNVSFPDPTTPAQTCTPRPVIGVATGPVNVTVTCSP
jgi:hypothetical protein